MLAVEDEVVGLAKTIADCQLNETKLTDRMVALEQYSRPNNVLISGVPMLENENLRDIVRALAIDVKDHDIDVVHRLPERNGEATITVKLNSRELKEAIIRNSKRSKLNSEFLNIQNYPTTLIYCEDHLIPEYKRVFMKAKHLKETRVLKHVWVSDCAVRVRITDDS